MKLGDMLSNVWNSVQFMTYFPKIDIELSDSEFFGHDVQVNLCQHLFLNQLTHNMTKQCSLIYLRGQIWSEKQFTSQKLFCEILRGRQSRQIKQSAVIVEFQRSRRNGLSYGILSPQIWIWILVMAKHRNKSNLDEGNLIHTWWAPKGPGLQ